MSIVMLFAAASLPATSHASLLSGEALDTAANVVAWLALIIVPVALISAFWIVHILPEKIAEKRRHPQLDAIKILCLLSLVFGGMLWPLAWLWAYTRPVLHKMAYGTDVASHQSHGEAISPLHDAEVESGPALEASEANARDRQPEVDELKRRIRSLEMALAMANDPSRGGRARTGDDEE
ncbi:DUF3302 domain-containing protein [Lysobacter panacisoli]|nr:DUF3302 domain-containing protein [Lysobacter panacisoli]